MSVNIKELCKHIKQSSKNSLIWTLEDGIHYITNRHWAVKFNELPREVLVTLFSAFAKTPKEGHSLVITLWGEDEERPAVSLKKIFEGVEANKAEGTITNIILDYGKDVYRVIKTKDSIIRLNNKYMSMVEVGTQTAKCAGRLQPVTFGENQLILLPCRSENSKEEETIEGLLAG
jgi:hypothetical protein